MNKQIRTDQMTANPYNAIGLLPGRQPRRHGLMGATIVSADNHICLGGEDFFYDNAPSALKDRVPRITYSEPKGYWELTIDGKPFYPFGSEALVRSMEGPRGAWDIDQRVMEMSAEGIDMEIAFPQIVQGLFNYKDYEVRGYVMREYNRYLAKLQRRQPGRFYGVAIPNYWDPAEAKNSIDEIRDAGLKVMMLPNKPGIAPNGQEIVYASDEMRPLWQAIADADLPVCFHIGENAGFAGKGGFVASSLNGLGAADFRPTFGKLVFGGILDDFPALRVVFAEGNLHWVPGLLQDADMMGQAFTELLDYVPKMPPSAYWHRNCYATFMHDPAGLQLIETIGVGNAMWSVDYPHNEGTFGYTGAAVQAIVDAVGETNAKLLCGGNARSCFKI